MSTPGLQLRPQKHQRWLTCPSARARRPTMSTWKRLKPPKWWRQHERPHHLWRTRPNHRWIPTNQTKGGSHPRWRKGHWQGPNPSPRAYVVPEFHQRRDQTHLSWCEPRFHRQSPKLPSRQSSRQGPKPSGKEGHRSAMTKEPAWCSRHWNACVLLRIPR